MNTILLRSCRKAYTADSDKAVPPAETLRAVRSKLKNAKLDIAAETRRIDNGRLDIPVYLSICGQDARAVMPVRKQMGKGASPEQAEASALMELMERYAFFSFWERQPDIITASWSEAERKFGSSLIPVSEILKSVNDSLDEASARAILDACEWRFFPATRILDGQIVWLPLDWFKMLGEFNGSSAGNTNEESILQGLCELIERHVCAIAAASRPQLPTIDAGTTAHPVLSGLIEKFQRNGIKLVLKDMSLGMPFPTVGVLAWDEQTFPDASEIVFTAGTAASPVKAAIRAITEAAQLGGDFNSGSCYEASGLPKYASLEECRWLLAGPSVKLEDMPNPERGDIRDELLTCVRALAPTQVYSVETTHPDIGVPCHYTIAPGLQFRERDANQSLGLFAGRKLAEEAEPEKAAEGLAAIRSTCPDAHYLPFFEGLLALRLNDSDLAAALMEDASRKQPDAESKGLVSFYAGYAWSLANRWEEALPWFMEAARLSPQMKEAHNYLGTARFRLKRYAEAEACFEAALKIDKGSAVDLANRGICRKFLGKSKSAREDLEAALELDPTLDFARKQLSEIQ